MKRKRKLNLPFLLATLATAIAFFLVAQAPSPLWLGVFSGIFALVMGFQIWRLLNTREKRERLVEAVKKLKAEWRDRDWRKELGQIWEKMGPKEKKGFVVLLLVFFLIASPMGEWLKDVLETNLEDLRRRP